MPRFKNSNATVTEGGFVRASIGKCTHSLIKAEARERGISQNELIKEAVTSYTGKTIDSIPLIRAERPLASVNLAKIEANTEANNEILTALSKVIIGYLNPAGIVASMMGDSTNKMLAKELTKRLESMADNFRAKAGGQLELGGQS
jgi:hypothetical protein